MCTAMRADIYAIVLRVCVLSLLAIIIHERDGQADGTDRGGVRGDRQWLPLGGDQANASSDESSRNERTRGASWTCGGA